MSLIRGKQAGDEGVITLTRAVAHAGTPLELATFKTKTQTASTIANNLTPISVVPYSELTLDAYEGL